MLAESPDQSQSLGEQSDHLLAVAQNWHTGASHRLPLPAQFETAHIFSSHIETTGLPRVPNCEDQRCIVCGQPPI
jgi:hypothetical protein